MKITQEQLKKEGIKVGDYYVVRRGARITVVTKGSEAWTDDDGRLYPAEDPATEIVFTEKQARHLLGSADRLRQKEKEKDGLEDNIRAIREQIWRLEAQIDALEEKQANEIVENFKNYEITLNSDGDGISFGCTEVSKDKLRAIKKLLDKK